MALNEKLQKKIQAVETEKMHIEKDAQEKQDIAYEADDRLKQQRNLNDSLQREIDFQKKLNGQLQLTIERMEQAQKQEKDQRALSEENKSQKYEKTENAMAQQIEALKNQMSLVEDQLKVKNLEQQSHMAIEQELRNKNDQLLT